MALAIDPTLKGDDTAAIVISVLYRGCAIPVAPYPVRGRLWRILRAKRLGSWMDPILELLQALAPAAPAEMTVIVLCDRGLTSPKLWRQIRGQSLPRTGYGAIKSLGWQWHKTRRTDPAPISRHWLVLSVATLLALAYGTRVEDAQERKIDPGRLRTPHRSPAPQRRGNSGHRPARPVSVIRYGIGWLRRLLYQGRLWRRVWLLPEPWPEPQSQFPDHPPCPFLNSPLHTPVRYPVRGRLY